MMSNESSSTPKEMPTGLLNTNYTNSSSYGEKAHYESPLNNSKKAPFIYVQSLSEVLLNEK